MTNTIPEHNCPANHALLSNVVTCSCVAQYVALEYDHERFTFESENTNTPRTTSIRLKLLQFFSIPIAQPCDENVQSKGENTQMYFLSSTEVVDSGLNEITENNVHKSLL